VAAALFAHAVAASAVQAPAQAPGRAALDPYVGRLLTVQVSIHGLARPLRLLFDTGGGQTLLTPGAAREVKCVPFGRSVGFRMTGERVEFQRCGAMRLALGGVDLAVPDMGVWDLAKVLPPDLPALDGVLAFDAFRATRIALDIAGRTIELLSAPDFAARVAAATELRARVATGEGGAGTTIFLAVGPDPTRPSWFLLDSANLEPVILAPHVAAPDPDRTGPREQDIQVVGLPPVRLPAVVREIIHDGALNEAWMRRYVFLIDVAAGRMWAAQRPQVPQMPEMPEVPEMLE
jgi:hypothetical protein